MFVEMSKKQVQEKVLKNDKPLALNRFTWDKRMNTFSSKEDNLRINFEGIDNTAFIIANDCNLTTGNNCTIEGGSYNFFETGDNCVFNTETSCIFKTSFDCAFNTGRNCTFATAHSCTFNTKCDCTFRTGINCVVVRRDIYEVIELKEGYTIQLNSFDKKGFVILEQPITEED